MSGADRSARSMGVISEVCSSARQDVEQATYRGDKCLEALITWPFSNDRHGSHSPCLASWGGVSFLLGTGIDLGAPNSLG